MRGTYLCYCCPAEANKAQMVEVTWLVGGRGGIERDLSDSTV